MLELKDLPSFDTLSQFAKLYPNPDIDGVQTWLLLSRGCSDMMAEFEANLARHGLSQTKFFVLLLLKRNPDGMGVGRLAEGVSVSSPTMTGIVDRLEQAQLCRREQDVNDRRAWVVRLLPAGEALLALALPEHYHWVAQLMSVFSPQERDQLRGLMRKLTTSLADNKAIAA
ncbi:MarR family winged helix-turn-helix transcriptional regulator [Rugamonas apoptosis]|uniref:MarR family transcriptional regulator n=1 Tax=Rugamonas apoptosis TaxID=2758570 RepID=A0A7W2FB31_9BURK|nr:MarR family transcriptional regulator [Rugamonas apoptosis]MBA5688362.1 MarR family transcriptional regulator [Rugamonas apoptosis]